MPHYAMKSQMYLTLHWDSGIIMTLVFSSWLTDFQEQADASWSLKVTCAKCQSYGVIMEQEQHVLTPVGCIDPTKSLLIPTSGPILTLGHSQLFLSLISVTYMFCLVWCFVFAERAALTD